MATGNVGVAAVLVLTVQRLENDTLTALNLMVSGFGKVTPGTKAFTEETKLDLINDDGTPKDKELAEALVFEVNKRATAGSLG